MEIKELDPKEGTHPKEDMRLPLDPPMWTFARVSEVSD